MSFMDVLKAREIDPFLYAQAKKKKISRQEMDMAYDIFEKDYIKKILLHAVKNDKNPLSYKLKDIKASKETYLRQDSYLNFIGKLLRKFIENITFKSLMRYEKETKEKLSIEMRNEIDDLLDVLYGLSMLDKNTKLGSKKKKPRPTKETLPIELLEKAFVSIAANGFREDSEDIQNLKAANIKSAIPKIQDFFLDGRPYKQLHPVLLENTEAKWDASTENWMYDEKIAYRKYQDKDSRELFIELQKGLGLDTISRKEVSSSRESLMEHFDLGDYEKLIEEIMTIVPKKSEEYSEQEEKLLFTTKYNKLESALIEIAMETIELQDRLETHRRSPPKSELSSVEKYLDVAEFLIAVLKLRGDYMALPQIEDPLEDIDVPRNVNLERRFPELESAANNYMNKTNVRKKLGE